MILQSLHEYYQRKSADPESGIAPPGFEWKEIPFIIVLDNQGNFMDLEDTREPDGKKKRAKSFLVPKAVKKSVNIAGNLLWDNVGYIFGIDLKGKPERAQKQKEAFIGRVKATFPVPFADPGINAILKFLTSDQNDELIKHPLWEEVLETNPNLSFRLQGEKHLVCERQQVKKAVADYGEDGGENGICLVTGGEEPLERLHPAIKGVWGAQSSGANIVSFNLDAFRSFGKAQGFNAPVSKSAASAYTTALNDLLGKDSRQRIQIGDASTVFWAERQNLMENLLSELFNESPKDDPGQGARAVSGLYASPQTGAPPLENDPTRFYVLGLSPNAARISIRFWHVATVGELARTIRRHFEDIRIEHPSWEPEHLSIWRILISTAALGKSENIPPNLAGAVMTSILSGQPYPRTLLQSVLSRIRAEQATKDKKGNVTYPRAALIKACINRHNRFFNPKEKEVTVSLDETIQNIGYRLGRLFAVLEKIQEEANPGINATIRDRFYGAASSTPASVFSTLLRLKNHHVTKLENRGRAINLEKLIGKILDGDEVNDFPPVLSLENQGRFAIGYYHQRQNFFNKPDEEKGE